MLTWAGQTVALECFRKVSSGKLRSTRTLFARPGALFQATRTRETSRFEHPLLLLKQATPGRSLTRGVTGRTRTKRSIAVEINSSATSMSPFTRRHRPIPLLHLNIPVPIADWAEPGIESHFTTYSHCNVLHPRSGQHYRGDVRYRQWANLRCPETGPLRLASGAIAE